VQLRKQLQLERELQSARLASRKRELGRKGENVADWSAGSPVAVADQLVRIRTMLRVRDLG